MAELPAFGEALRKPCGSRQRLCRRRYGCAPGLRVQIKNCTGQRGPVAGNVVPAGLVNGHGSRQHCYGGRCIPCCGLQTRPGSSGESRGESAAEVVRTGIAGRLSLFGTRVGLPWGFSTNQPSSSANLALPTVCSMAVMPCSAWLCITMGYCRRFPMA